MGMGVPLARALWTGFGGGWPPFSITSSGIKIRLPTLGGQLLKLIAQALKVPGF